MGHRIRGDTVGILQQEGYSRKDRIRKKTGGSGGPGGQGDRRARGQGEQGGYSRRDRIRRRTGEGGIPLGDTAGTLKACKLVVVQQQDCLDTH